MVFVLVTVIKFMNELTKQIGSLNMEFFIASASVVSHHNFS